MRKSLGETFLFEHVPGALLDRALGDPGCEVCRYEAESLIYSRSAFRRSLGFLVSGSALVRTPGGRGVILRRLEPGMSFGAAALFSSDAFYVTDITAETACTVLFLTQELISALMQENFQVARNYIGFLSGRIVFLNGLIDSYAAQSAEGKLARFLLLSLRGADGDEIPLQMSMSRLAESLGIGRASLYRALDRLEQEGLVRRQAHSIRVLDCAALEQVK